MLEFRFLPIVNVPKRPVRLDPSVESGGLDDTTPTREIFAASNVEVKLVLADWIIKFPAPVKV